MRFYFAPMEGITLHPFRQIHHEFFPGITKYFTPFLVANQTCTFKRKEIRDILPENNRGLSLVPQILGNKAEEVWWALRELQSYGYQELNLNLGCPSPTVTSRGKGAGFLADPDRLDAFLDSIFEKRDRETGEGIEPFLLSVKTRIGIEDGREAAALLSVYNRYPIHELIVHPMFKKQLYKGTPDLDVFQMFYEESRNPVCYNGDIRTAEDQDELLKRFPKLEAVMIGRGLVRDPSLVRQLQGNEGADLLLLRKYHDALAAGYRECFADDLHVIGKMKEIWYYMEDRVPHVEKDMKKLHKARNMAQYEAAAAKLFGTGQ